MIPHALGRGLTLFALLATTSPAPAGVTWLPASYEFHPRSRADWKEPRMGLTWHGDMLEAALGGPVALARGESWGVTLEGLASLGLAREGSFFPLETLDGFMQAGWEGRLRAWRGKVRVVHWSAHKADGDTTVAYRDRTFSREWVSAELGRAWGPVFTYARAARPWHAVPESPGWKLALGWILEPGPRGGPALYGHLAWDRATNYRVSHSHLLAWALGARNRVYLGLRHQSGFSPRGQYAESRDRFWGLEVQFRPRARGRN